MLFDCNVVGLYKTIITVFDLFFPISISTFWSDIINVYEVIQILKLNSTILVRNLRKNNFILNHMINIRFCFVKTNDVTMKQHFLFEMNHLNWYCKFPLNYLFGTFVVVNSARRINISVYSPHTNWNFIFLP